MGSLVACFLVFENCVSSSSIKRRFLNFGVREVLKIDPSSKLSWLRRQMMPMIVLYTSYGFCLIFLTRSSF